MIRRTTACLALVLGAGALAPAFAQGGGGGGGGGAGPQGSGTGTQGPETGPVTPPQEGGDPNRPGPVEPPRVGGEAPPRGEEPGQLPDRTETELSNELSRQLELGNVPEGWMEREQLRRAGADRAGEDGGSGTDDGTGGAGLPGTAPRDGGIRADDSTLRAGSTRLPGLQREFMLPPPAGEREGARVSVTRLQRASDFSAFRLGLMQGWTDASGRRLTANRQNVMLRSSGPIEVWLVEQGGTFTPREGTALRDQRVVTAFVRDGSDAWEVRLQGTPRQIEVQRNAFMRWLDDVRAARLREDDTRDLPSGTVEDPLPTVPDEGMGPD